MDIKQFSAEHRPRPEMSITIMDIFRPTKDGPKDCIVINPEGGAISGLSTREEAEAYAARAVNGRIGQLNGTIECYVCIVTPVVRVRDKNLANTSMERLDGETTAAEPQTALLPARPLCVRCGGTGRMVRPDKSEEKCVLCDGHGTTAFSEGEPAPITHDAE